MKKVECLANNKDRLEKRSREVVHDYENTITNWEWLKTGPRYKWKNSEIEKRLRDFSHDVVAAEKKSGNQTFIQGLLKLLRGFSRADYEEARDTKQFQPKDLLEWLRSGSNDLKLVPYYYPGSKAPRLRLLNSFDQFEILIISADELSLFWTNYGSLYLSFIANAWGDEPREAWPEELQREYPKRKWSGKMIKRPPTLREVFTEISGHLAKIEKVIGYPKFNCSRASRSGRRSRGSRFSVDPPGDRTDDEMRNDFETVDFDIFGLRQKVKIPSVFRPHTIKSHLYNLRQTMTVLEKGLPDRGSNSMQIMRNLFWEIEQSTPKKNRKATSGRKNHLRFVADLARMGIFRQLSKTFRGKQEASDYQLDTIETLIKAAYEPQTQSLLAEILTERKTSGGSKTSILLETVHPVLEFLDKESDIKTEEERKKFKTELADLKVMPVFTLALLNKFSDPSIISRIIQLLNGWLLEHGDFLTEKNRLGNWLMGAGSAANKIQGIYDLGESGHSSGVVDETFGSFESVLENLLNDPILSKSLMQWIRVAGEDPVISRNLDLFDMGLTGVRANIQYQQNVSALKIARNRIIEMLRVNPRLRLEIADLLSDESADAVGQMDDVMRRDVDGFHDLIVRVVRLLSAPETRKLICQSQNQSVLDSCNP